MCHLYLAEEVMQEGVAWINTQYSIDIIVSCV